MSDIITITGNVAADPEHTRTGAGLAITRFGVVTNDRRYDKELGRWVDGASNYYRVSAFRGLAENAFASLRRGERVIVSGRLRISKWENASGSGTTIEIDAESLGHDLLFGRTVYQRNVRSAPSDSAGSPAPETGRPGDDPETAASTADADGWSPRAAADPAAEADDDGAPHVALDRELVLLSEPTPF